MPVLSAATGELHVGGREGRRCVEPEPAEEQDERTQQRHRDVVSRKRSGGAVLGVLADAWPQHDRPGQRSGTPCGVHDARAGEVDVAEPQLEAVAELREPPAAPGPRTEERVVDGAAEQAPPDEALELPPFRHRTRGDGRRGVHEGHHVEEEGGSGSEHLRVDARHGPGSGPQEHPVPGADEIGPQRVGQPEHAVAEPSEHDGEADQEEADQSQTEDRQVGRDHVRSVLRPTESGLDHGEPGLHEDDQRRAEDDPQHVEPHAHIGGSGDQRTVEHRLGDALCPGDPREYDECREQRDAERDLGLSSVHHPGLLLLPHSAGVGLVRRPVSRAVFRTDSAPLRKDARVTSVGVTARGPLQSPPTTRRSCTQEEQCVSSVVGPGGPRR